MKHLRFILLCIVAFTAASAFISKPASAFADRQNVKDDSLTATDSILIRWLSRTAVDANPPAFKNFYLWLEPQELDSVLKENKLLRNAKAQTTMEAVYENIIFSKSYDRHPVAQQLRKSSSLFKREAWTSCWTGLTEVHDNDPRTQLVMVELEDSAWIACVNTSAKQAWKVYDIKGNLIPENEVIKYPSRIASVCFVETLSGKKASAIEEKRRLKLLASFGGNQHVVLRSFILCNESMIRNWKHAVPGVQEHILNEIKYLLLLNAYWQNDPSKQVPQGKEGKYALKQWNAVKRSNNISALFYSNLRITGNGGVNAEYFWAKRCVDMLRFRWMQQNNPADKYPSKGK
ncbi:MAG: hypothetical protein Fur0041_17230 [Bacteroidia bacterium]